jgi:hypothetical protein
LQKEGFQHLAKSYSYNYCEYYEEIPGNNFVMIFYLKVDFWPKPCESERVKEDSPGICDSCKIHKICVVLLLARQRFHQEKNVF